MGLRKILITFITFFHSIFICGNNVQISNVALVNQNTTLKFTMVKFDISWQNSWRTSTLESNWDAVWIFVKYRRKWDHNWYPAYLNDIGHVSPAGATITPGFVRTDVSFNATTNPAVGVFIYRSTNGIGNVNFTNVQLRWNYGVNGLADYDSVEVCVYGIEMVYIPQGSFYVGDNLFPGTNSTNYFVAGTTNIPFLITSESPLNIDNTANTSLWVAGGTTSGVLPANFPKGFQSFYIMKYELSQEMYKEFLNKISRSQQANRSTITVGNFHPNNTTPPNRCGVRLINDPGAPLPRIYGCDLNANGTPNEINDGGTVSMPWVSFADLTAFADWAGLRPLTELEYEKACRGTLQPVPNEYAWGTPNYTVSTGIVNNGQANEGSSNSANIVFGNHPSVQGPMRSGCFASSGTNRIQAGASYYGVMDLSGNLWELAYSIGVVSQRSFDGHRHGDGLLDASGNHNVTGWINGAGYRGGSWANTTTQPVCQVSDRFYSAWNDWTPRYSSNGIRLGRTAN